VPKGQLPPWAAAYDGATYRKAKLDRYVSVSAAVFKDEATAKSFTAKLRSAQYLACVQKGKAEEIAKDKKAAPGSTWRAEPEKAGTGPLEAKYHFIYQARVKGKIVDANGRQDVSAYRFGRLVTVLFHTSSTSPQDPKGIVPATDRDLKKAASRIQQRARS
jgi:hypothetical protein